MLASQSCCNNPKIKAKISLWKCGLYRKTICLFINTAFILSIVSSLDCKFISVNVGFIPEGSNYQLSALRIGLWSLQNPAYDGESDGQCLSPNKSKEYADLTGDGHSSFYGRLFVNDDPIWTVSQVSAFVGMIVGILNVVSGSTFYTFRPLYWQVYSANLLMDHYS